MSIGDPPSRNTTAPNPRTRPARTLGARRWRSHTAETIAVKSGVVAIRSEASDAGRLSVAKASSEKGIAENVAPTIRNAAGWRRAASNAQRELMNGRTTPAIAVGRAAPSSIVRMPPRELPINTAGPIASARSSTPRHRSDAARYYGPWRGRPRVTRSDHDSLPSVHGSATAPERPRITGNAAFLSLTVDDAR